MSVQQGSTLVSSSRGVFPAVSLNWYGGEYYQYMGITSGQIGGTLQLQVQGMLDAPQVAATFLDWQVNGRVSLSGNSELGTRPPAVSVRGALTLGETARFDLGTGMLTLRAEPGDFRLRNALAGGFAGGTWAGYGIMSSRAGAGGATGAEALALLSSPDWIATLRVGDFTLGASTVIYTYLGDTDGSGVVDLLDFANFEIGYAHRFDWDTPYTGWRYGDFNYDGRIDNVDRALLDLGFVEQGVPLGIAALVPEPRGMVGAVIPVAMALGRRRRP